MGYCSIHKQKLPEDCECPNCALENTHCHHSPSKSDGKCKKCGKVLFVHRKGCASRCGGAGTDASAAADAYYGQHGPDEGEGYEFHPDLVGLSQVEDEDPVAKMARLQAEYTPAPTRLEVVRQKVLARPPEGRDLVTNPPHYMVLPEKQVEAKHIVEAVLNSGEPVEPYDNSCLGNAIEYLLRCKKKGNMRMDLRKAKEYINIILGEPYGK